MKTFSQPLIQPSPANLRPELALLLCCARTKLEAEHRERTETLLRGEIDWRYLIDVAHTHGILPLVTRNLLALFPTVLPKAITGQLQRHFHANAFHSRFLTRELLKLLKLFETRGIPCLPYKGPSLAVAAYGDPTLRQFVDLDLLIHKKNFASAKELLLAEGYQTDFSSSQETTLLQFHYHAGFARADGKVPVELHWEVTWRYWPLPLDFARLWQQAASVVLEGRTIPSLPPEDLLFILCVHGGKHWWARLLWLCDIAELVRVQRQMDWQRLLARASSAGGKRLLLLGLFLASDLLGANLPEVIRHSIAEDRRVKAIAAQLRSQIFAGVQNPHDAEDRPLFYRTAFYLGVRERLRDKVQFFARYPLRPYLSALPQRFAGLRKPRGGPSL